MHHQHRIIVAGAGLGGLALANGLRRHGFDVTVHERDSHPLARRQGYRIQLDQPGLGGLQACLPERLYRLALATAAAPPAHVYVRNRSLELLADRAALNGAGGQDHRPYSFNRPTLREILLADLGDSVRYGAAVTGYRHNLDGTVSVDLAGGDCAVADVLVGADGVGSVVRRQLLLDAAPSDAGLRLIYGKIPLTEQTIPDIPRWAFDGVFTVVTGGPGHPHVGVGPIQFLNPPAATGHAANPPVSLSPVDDYLAFLVGGPSDHPAMPPDQTLKSLPTSGLHDVARQLLAEGWHPDIGRLLDLWDTESLLPLRISTSTRVEPWTDGPITLLGDAVHAMSPVLAMGANTAIRDAGELARALAHAQTSGTPLVDALRAYETQMIDYAFDVVESSQRTGRTRVGQN